MVDLEMVADQRVLIAATHGLGIFYLRLPPAAPAAPASLQRQRWGWGPSTQRG